MLTPKYLKFLPNPVVKIFEELEEDILSTLAARISKDLRVSATSDFQIGQLVAMGYNGEDIQKAIIERSSTAIIPMEKILQDSAELKQANEIALYERGGKQLTGLKTPMNNFIASAIKQASYDVDNITKTLGISVNGNNFELVEYYRNAVNKAVFEIGTGLYTTEEVIEHAIKPLAESGIKVINYASGRADQIDVAVRRAVLSTNARISGEISMRNARLMDQDLMEITAHYGARPSHADFQGKVVSLSGKSGYLSLDDVGFSEGWGLFGYNCRHDWYPYFEGISAPNPPFEEREPITFGNKEYNSYEASQYQRKIERDIRATKREISAYKGANLSTQQRNAEIELNRQRKLYSDFLKASDRRAVRSMTGITGQFNLGDINYNPTPSKAAKDVFRQSTPTLKNYPVLGEAQLDQAQRKMYDYLGQYEIEEVLGNYVGTPRSFATNSYMYTGRYEQDLANYAQGISYRHDADLFKRANELKELLSKHELPYDMKLFRYTGAEEVESIFKKVGLQKIPKITFDTEINDAFLNNLNQLKGAKYVTESFVSTSYDDAKNAFTQRPIKIEILADKGVKGIITDNWSESEIILNAGYEYEIVGFKTEERKLPYGFSKRTGDLLTLVIRVLK